MFVCTICDQFAGRSFASVLRHIGSIHRFDPGLSIRCGIKACPETYTNFESFRSHVYRKHRDILHLDDSQSTHTESIHRNLSTMLDNPIDDDITTRNDPITSDQQSSGTGVNLQLSEAKFLLQIKEECKLTQASVDKIVFSVRGLWSEAMCGLQERLKQSSPDVELNIDKSIFNNTPFDGLETQYLQQKYYREHFSYVVCTN